MGTRFAHRDDSIYANREIMSMRRFSDTPMSVKTLHRESGNAQAQSKNVQYYIIPWRQAAGW